MTKVIDTQGLARRLHRLRSSQFVSVESETQPKMRKTNNPYLERVKKRTIYSGIVNFKYEDGVNRRRTKEGKDADFSAKQNWFEGVYHPDGSLKPIVRKKSDKTCEYLYFQVRHSDSEFLIDNRVASPEEVNDIKRYLYSSGKNEHQGVENTLDVRTVALDSIRKIRFSKKEFTIGG